MTMSKDKAMKVFDVLGREGDMTFDDMEFLHNNLAPFADLLIEVGVNLMVTAGIEKEEALAVLHNLAMVSRMAGASSFTDFVKTEQMLRGE